MRWFVLFPLALLLIVLLAVPGAALAASPGQTSPVPAPPGLTTPDTKPAVPATAPAPTPEGGPSSPWETS